MIARDSDWLYLKIYSGAGDDVGALLPAVLRWKAGLRGVGRWHFLRYVDVLGHHLRLRLRGRPDDVDDWYEEIPRLSDLVRHVSARSMTRFIRDPMVVNTGRWSGVSVSTYSPELAKYGGLDGIEDTEAHFEQSSHTCVVHKVWGWSPQERLVAASDFIAAVERALGLGSAQLANRIADRWAGRLRYGGLDPARLHRQAPLINERVRAGTVSPADWGGIASAVAGLVAAHEMTAAPEFALDVIHMHVNRIGLNPLEECLAAHLSAADTTTTLHP